MRLDVFADMRQLGDPGFKEIALFLFGACTTHVCVDGILLEWGSLLYYPRPKRTKAGEDVRLVSLMGSTQRSSTGSANLANAAEIRRRIAATVRRAPQVVVKITGGGRGMKFIRAHFNYISKRGRLELTDEQGQAISGRDGIRELSDDWQLAGAYLPESSGRREAFHIALSMPAGTDPKGLQEAVQAFVAKEFAEHKHVRVFHGHQANPHVHLVVKAENRHGQRLNPRKADLQRWREGFANALRERGIDAQATRQATHGAVRSAQPIWRASSDLGRSGPTSVSDGRRRVSLTTHQDALMAWAHVHNALARSLDVSDRELARHVRTYLKGAPAVRELLEVARAGGTGREGQQARQGPDRG